MRPNKALQPTPSRDAPVSYNRLDSLFTSLQSRKSILGTSVIPNDAKARARG